MTKTFKDAIRSTGGLARLAADEAQSFAASIQPCGFDSDGHSVLGTGFLKSYKLFAEYNETSQKLREGDVIVFDGRFYSIKNVAPSLFGVKPVYLSGMLMLCEDGDV